MDFDLDDPEDAIFVLAVLDEEDGPATVRTSVRGPSGVPGGAGGGGSPGGCGSGCAGCGCAGCLMPALAIAGVAAAGFGALPLAAVLCGVALALVLMDRGGR